MVSKSTVMPNFKTIPGSICAPLGFRAAAVFCDIKRLGTGKGSEKGKKRDLALIVSDTPAAVAGMFTSNQVCAAPVKVSARNANDHPPEPSWSIPETRTLAPGDRE